MKAIILLFPFFLLFGKSYNTTYYDTLFIKASAARFDHQYMVEPAREEIIKLQDDILPFLVTKINTEQPREYHALREIFRKIDGKKLYKFLEPELKKCDRETFYSASYFLGRTGDKDLAEKLLPFLDHDSSYIVISTIKALGELRDSTAVENLVKLSTNEDMKVRWAVAATSGLSGGLEAVKLLVSLLEDNSQLVSHTSFFFLDRLLKENPAYTRFIDTGNELKRTIIKKYEGIDFKTESEFMKFYGVAK
ncbi:MAG: HEAT repeat domain-containing protein [Candidatus Delongbacteria bacterium]|nr:HEAT repeat domain-containing protein [Candidatus Delongbacteria bacterium]MBN2836744.1 HEAT repeat domain-containing protein [Candidatus Delongbacteria bacterium]